MGAQIPAKPCHLLVALVQTALQPGEALPIAPRRKYSNASGGHQFQVPHPRTPVNCGTNQACWASYNDGQCSPQRRVVMREEPQGQADPNQRGQSKYPRQIVETRMACTRRIRDRQKRYGQQQVANRQLIWEARKPIKRGWDTPSRTNENRRYGFVRILTHTAVTAQHRLNAATMNEWNRDKRDGEERANQA